MDGTSNTSEPVTRTRPQLQRSKTSAGHNAAMRRIIRPWASLTSTPPGCRTVSFSSWTRFTPDIRNEPKEPPQASVLCAGAETTPDFDPPLLERANLAVEQPKACVTGDSIRCEENEAKTQVRQQSSSASSWATATSYSTMSTMSTCGTPASEEPITFCKIEVKPNPSPPSSLLTEALTNGYPVRNKKVDKVYALKAMARELGVSVLDPSHLPESCFEDSAEED